MGLGVRAGTVVVGTSGVRGALQKAQLALVVVPQDMSDRTRDKVVRLAAASGTPMMEAPSARALGAMVGHDEVQAVGVRDPALARGIRAEQGDELEG